LLAAIHAGDGTAVESRQQRIVVIGNQVDQVLIERFLRSVGVRRLRRGGGGIDVASTRA
jgi:hypothetical protein